MVIYATAIGSTDGVSTDVQAVDADTGEYRYRPVPRCPLPDGGRRDRWAGRGRCLRSRPIRRRSACLSASTSASPCRGHGAVVVAPLAVHHRDLVGDVDDDPPVPAVVGGGQRVLGDNRQASFDSRQIGYFPRHASWERSYARRTRRPDAVPPVGARVDRESSAGRCLRARWWAPRAPACAAKASS